MPDIPCRIKIKLTWTQCTVIALCKGLRAVFCCGSGSNWRRSPPKGDTKSNFHTRESPAIAYAPIFTLHLKLWAKVSVAASSPVVCPGSPVASDGVRARQRCAPIQSKLRICTEKGITGRATVLFFTFLLSWYAVIWRLFGHFAGSRPNHTVTNI